MNSDKRFSELIELIYQATLEPEAWALVSEQTGRLLKSSVALFVQDMNSPDFKILSQRNFEQEALERYGQYFYKINPLIPLTFDLPEGAVSSIGGLIPRERIDKTEYYNDWMRPQGLYHSCGTSFRIASGTSMFLTYHRARPLGEYSAETLSFFQSLVPHVRRAATIGKKLDYEKAFSSAGRLALDRIAGAALLLTRSGAVTDMTPEAQRLVQEETIVRVRFGRAEFPSDTDGTLKRHLKTVIDTRAASEFSMVCHKTGQTYSALLTPASEHSYWLGSPEVLLILRTPQSPAPSAVEAFRARFMLSRAESRLLEALVGGATLAGYAEENSLSRNTVKTQLQSIFAKTGTSRQADLIRLAMRASLA
ncbi:helix-turn-helix transcriptional regulator [Microvirga flavescens]|uniref:helix-turn-helix transcriptional regulator n=1 Tax=Microvirga flavescens TaxID=2249811 RepID=UPI000DD9EF34|nr:hypothetical protein [Microvirga flavescens]